MDKSALPSIKNNILASLVPSLNEEGGSFVSHLEPVELKHGAVLYETGEQVRHVYFPNSSLISLVTEMIDGKIVEVGLVGSDGMSGLTALMGEGTSPERAIVQLADGAIRAELSVIQEEFMRGGQLQKLLLSYSRRLMRQVSQTAACNATHTAKNDSPDGS